MDDDRCGRPVSKFKISDITPCDLSLYPKLKDELKGTLTSMN